MNVLNPLEESSSELRLRQTRQLMYLMYIQSFLLGSYICRGRVARNYKCSDISVTQPEVVAHGIVSCTFAGLTAAVGFLAYCSTEKRSQCRISHYSYSR